MNKTGAGGVKGSVVNRKPRCASQGWWKAIGNFQGKQRALTTSLLFRVDRLEKPRWNYARGNVAEEEAGGAIQCSRAITYRKHCNREDEEEAVRDDSVLCQVGA